MRYYAVLGERLLVGDRLSSILRRRLLACLACYRVGDRVIVCGGNVCGVPYCRHTEAYVMRKFLVSRGVSSRDIILENRSLDTIDNIINLGEICDEFGIGEVTVITSSWHLPRVKYICRGLPARVRVDFKASDDAVSAERVKLERRYLRELHRGVAPPPRRCLVKI